MENLGGPLKSFPLAEQAARTEQARRRADRPDFEDYERTFHHLSDGELRWKHLLFRIIGNPTLNRTLNGLGGLAVKLRLPGADWAVRQTIYEQFVGGRSLAGAQPTIEKLGRLGVESILDYGAEAKQNKEDMDEAMQQILRSVHFADRTDAARATVVKLSSIIPFALLEKYNEAGGAAGAGEKEIPIDPEFETGIKRLDAICHQAHGKNVILYIDAEESWIQNTIDRLAERMMRRYNTERAVVHNTVQLYRHDKLGYFQDLIARGEAEGFRVGVKLVRGAYMVKENARAERRGYPTPIQPTLEATHRDYNEAVRLLFDKRDTVSGCLGTHNVASTRLLTDLIDEHGVRRDHPNLRFAQLLGMSDNLTFNLAHAGFSVAKYMVYGPVREVFPYLVRRAQENASVTGEAGRELQLIEKELRRRGL